MTWRLALDHRRGDRRREAREERASRPHAAHATPSHEADVLAVERSRRLWAVIDALPERLRLVVVLASIEEHSVRDVAATIGAPERPDLVVITNQPAVLRALWARARVSAGTGLIEVAAAPLPDNAAEIVVAPIEENPGVVPWAVTLKLTVVILRFEGEKKIGSLPFVLMVIPGGERDGDGTSIQMGSDVPIPTTTRRMASRPPRISTDRLVPTSPRPAERPMTDAST
jgi:hypothetical protein